MRFFDSCVEKVTWDDVLKDIEDDLDFEIYLSQLVELRKLEKALAAGKEDAYGEKTGHC